MTDWLHPAVVHEDRCKWHLALPCNRRCGVMGTFLCDRCKVKFRTRPGPGGGPCPACGSAYYLWLDYEKFALGGGEK